MVYLTSPVFASDPEFAVTFFIVFEGRLIVIFLLKMVNLFLSNLSLLLFLLLLITQNKIGITILV